MSEGGHSGDDKLVYMANQIARFFASQRHTDPAEGVADHLRLFWEPRMRRAILARLDAGGEGLDPVARAAVELLRAGAANQPTVCVGRTMPPCTTID